jgi:hypothetical protein
LAIGISTEANELLDIFSFKFGIKERADEKYVAGEPNRIISKNKSLLDGSIILVFLGGFLLKTKNKRIILFKKADGKIELAHSYKLPSDLIK